MSPCSVASVIIIIFFFACSKYISNTVQGNQMKFEILRTGIGRNEKDFVHSLKLQKVGRYVIF